jgi:hypothetical protein
MQTSGRYYKGLLIAVIAIFVVCLAAYVALGMVFSTPTPGQLHTLDGLDSVVKSTLGAMLGLLGGKAI